MPFPLAMMSDPHTIAKPDASFISEHEEDCRTLSSCEYSKSMSLSRVSSNLSHVTADTTISYSNDGIDRSQFRPSLDPPVIVRE